MQFLIDTLTTWRLTIMLMVKSDGSAERGPYAALDHLRDKLGLRFDDMGRPDKTTEIGQLLSCIYCLSFWTGLIVALLRKKTPLYALALSAATLFLNKWYKRP